MQNLIESIHFIKNTSYSSKVNTKNVMHWKKKVFLVQYSKRFHPKSCFYERVKDHKKGLQSLNPLS